MYLKPIINGTGNFYVEAEGRNRNRTDVIVDYCGKQYIIEIKIWRGSAYHQKGEWQLSRYLNDYSSDKGYLLTFDFRQNKTPGITQKNFNGKRIMEIIV